MQINPQTIKQLIQLESLKSLDILTNGGNPAAANEDSGLDFNEILMQFLGEQTGTESTEPADALPVLKPMDSYSIQMQALAAAGFTTGVSQTAVVHSDTSEPTIYQDFIANAAAKFSVDPSLIKGVIDAESGFRADAISSAGAKGLMQLMDRTAQGLGVTDSFDPQQNIEGGTRFLSYLLRKFEGNEDVALAAYNAGPGRMDQLGIATSADLLQKFNLLPTETQRYIGKVLDAKQKYA